MADGGAGVPTGVLVVLGVLAGEDVMEDVLAGVVVTVGGSELPNEGDDVAVSVLEADGVGVPVGAEVPVDEATGVPVTAAVGVDAGVAPSDPEGVPVPVALTAGVPVDAPVPVGEDELVAAGVSSVAAGVLVTAGVVVLAEVGVVAGVGVPAGVTDAAGVAVTGRGVGAMPVELTITYLPSPPPDQELVEVQVFTGMLSVPKTVLVEHS